MRLKKPFSSSFASQTRICLRAIVVFAKSSQRAFGVPSLRVSISTISPEERIVSSETNFPLTRAPAALFPISEWIVYAKSIVLDPLGRSMTSPAGVKTKIRSLKKSAFR